MKTLLITITALLLLLNCSNPASSEPHQEWEYYESMYCNVQDNELIGCPYM